MMRFIFRLLVVLACAIGAIGIIAGGQELFGQVTAPITIPNMQFLDGSGHPLASGKVYTYAAGTTTPLTTYQDNTLSNPNANPIVLNSAGRANIWGTATNYKFIVQNSLSVQQYTVDNVPVWVKVVMAPSGITQNTITKAGANNTLVDSQLTDDGNFVTLLPSDGRTDTTSWAQSLLRASRLQNSASNQFVMNIQASDTLNTGAAASYEKSGLLVQTITADPSGATLRDMVGVDARCQIWSAITTGRCWGSRSQVLVTTGGGDGFAVGSYIALDNGGTDQPLSGTTTSKYGAHIVAGQSAAYTVAGTAALYVDASTASWHNGLLAKQSTFTGNTANDSFINLLKTSATTSMFRVKTTGMILAGDLPNGSATGDYSSTYYGSLAVSQYLTVASPANQNKQMLALFADSVTSGMRIVSSRYDNSVSYLPITLEVGATVLSTFNEDGGIEFTTSTPSAAISAVGKTKLRNNAGNLEVSNNGAAYVPVSGSGGGSLGGSGTAGYISKWSAVTTLTNTNGPLLEYNSGADYTLVYGNTTNLDPAQYSIEGFKSSSTGSIILARNDSTSATAYAGVAARIGASSSSTITVISGVTSSGFTPAAPLSPSQAFIQTGAGTTAGLVLYTPAGAISYSPDGTTIDYKMTTDDAFEFTASSGAAVGAAGTVRLRNNAGTLELSNNGAAYTSVLGGGGGGSLGGSGSVGYISKWSAVTTLTNTAGPLFEDTGGNTGLVYGAAASDDSTQYKFNAITGSTTGGLIVVRNSTSGTTAYAGLGARSGAAANTDDITMGVTSAAYTTSLPLSAGMGFITTGQQTTNGFAIYTKQGAVNFAVAGTTINFKMSTDASFELTSSSTASVGAAGTVRVRNSAGTFQASENGGAWTNVIGSGGLTGSGTTNLVPKFSAATQVANSQIFDDGTSTSIGTQAATDNPTTIRLEVEKDQNNITDLLVRNNTSGTQAEADITVRTGSGSGDYTMGATSALFTPSGGITANAAKLYSGTALTAGQFIQTGAGPITFQIASSTAHFKMSTDVAFELSASSTAAVGAAGTVRIRNSSGTFQASENGGAWTNVIGAAGVSGSGTASLVPRWSSSTVLTNSQIFDDGTTTTIGTQAASDSTTNYRFQIQKDQNESSGALIRNATNNTLARAAWIARSGISSSNLDMSMGVTSPLYTLANGLDANTGFLVSGSSASNGILIHTEAGSVTFQVGGSANDCTISTVGLMTCTSFSGVGSNLTSLQASNITGTLAIGVGGTGVGSVSANAVVLGNAGATAYTSSTSFTLSGSNVNLSGGNFNLATSGQGVTFANGSSSISGTAFEVDIYPGASQKMKLDTTATNGVCIYIGGSLQRLKLSGSNVVVDGSC